VQGRERRRAEEAGRVVEQVVKLLLITDRTIATLEQTLRSASRILASHDPANVIFGVRDHDLSARERASITRALIDLARPLGARVVVHDRIDIALAVDADGVHLAERSIGTREARSLLPRGWIGRSCHDAAGIEAARDCDAITLSPLFASPGKGAALGVERFAELARHSAVPVYALGGVDFSNAPLATDAGASGVAMIRGWLDR
jgi:thiamine-phosphate pyrophosphorylase